MTDATDILYLNTRYLPKREASLPIEERAAMLGDGVYEVIRYCHGRGFAVQPHVERLRKSLTAIDMEGAADGLDLEAVGRTLLQRNGLREATVYWQVSRGAAPRSHVYSDGMTPTVLAIAYPAKPLDIDAPTPVISAITTEDRRWSDCWIKSLMLLPNTLAKTAAARVGAGEAIFVRNGLVTEGASTNVFIVRDGVLHTHPANRAILHGITRAIILELAEQAGVPVSEVACDVAQLYAADEVFVTGTGTTLVSVTRIDDQRIADGQPGPITRQLRRALIQRMDAECRGSVETKAGAL